MHENVNRERVALWIEALRDPNLIQGTGRLATRYSPDASWEQCCLDVACQVAIKNGLQITERIVEAIQGGDNSGGNVTKRGYEDNDYALLSPWNFASLPGKVMTWYGFMDSEVAKLQVSGELYSAIDLNDKLKFAFARIADILEANFPQVEQ